MGWTLLVTRVMLTVDQQHCHWSWRREGADQDSTGGAGSGTRGEQGGHCLGGERQGQKELPLL